MGNTMAANLQRVPGRVVSPRPASVFMGLGILVVATAIVLWPIGVWRVGVLTAGAVSAAFAVTRAERISAWFGYASGFMIGGTLVPVVFRGPFDARQCAGFALLIIWLAVDISAVAGPNRPGKR